MQKHHIEQGSFADILGAYQMASDGNTTADNTDAFITSPYQSLQEKKIFTIAKELANAMKQESVAVFVPSRHAAIGEAKVSFTSHLPKITEAVQMIHDKLPPAYSQAYSLHLKFDCTDFENAKVNEIEWLGSKINSVDIENAFPDEKISYQNGNAYLVYKNGTKELL